MDSPEWPALRRRVLIVSADMGGGHDATGRALEEEVARLWPGSHVCWVDTLDVMGWWVGPVFRGAYVLNIRHTPSLYQFFYALNFFKLGIKLEGEIRGIASLNP